jgi:hypothetical protein
MFSSFPGVLLLDLEVRDFHGVVYRLVPILSNSSSASATLGTNKLGGLPKQGTLAEGKVSVHLASLCLKA